jgi:hypothetical protein
MYSSILWLFGVGLVITRGNLAEIALMVTALWGFYNPHHYHIKFAEIYLLVPCLMFLLRKSQTPFYVTWCNNIKQRLLGPPINSTAKTQ